MFNIKDYYTAGGLIEDTLARLPEGYRFLLRQNDDERGAYFCNFISPDMRSEIILITGQPARQVGPGRAFGGFGATMVEAVTAAERQIGAGLLVAR